jgi:hypothetical protein
MWPSYLLPENRGLSKAAELLQAALNKAESIHGHMSEETASINTQLVAVRHAIEVDLGHRKRALVASTGGKLNERPCGNTVEIYQKFLI